MSGHRMTLADLDSRQRRIVADKRLSERMPPTDWLRLLAPLARFELATSRLRKQTRDAGLFSVAALFVTFIILAMSGFQLWLVPLPVTCLVLGVVASRRYQRLKSLALAGKLPRVVVPLLAMLVEDGADGAPAQLELDLRPADVPEKLVRDENLPPAGRYDRIWLRVYQDPWMRGQAELRDGTRIEWRVVDEVRHLQRRQSYGKRKTKSKLRNRSTLTVTLALPKGHRVAAATPATDAATAASTSTGTDVRVTPGDKRDRIEVSRVIKAASIESPEAAHLLDVIAVAFARARGAVAARAVGA